MSQKRQHHGARAWSRQEEDLLRSIFAGKRIREIAATLGRTACSVKPMDIERAKAVCKVSETIIESAKVEVKFLEITGNRDEKPKFFEERKAVPALPNGKVHQA
jgi:hypothetical protein